MTRAGLLIALLWAGGAAADELADAEGRVAQALRVQEEWRARKDALEAEVATLAEELARRTPRPDGVRADAALAERLRAFDREAARLDALDREWGQAGQKVERARQAFQSVIEARSRQAAGAELLRLEAAQRRVLAAPADDGPRPPLDIEALDSDTPAELVAKQALLQSECLRLGNEPQRLARASTLLAARLDWKRRLLAEARNARRAAGSEWRLIAAEADALQADVRALEREGQELQARAHTLQDWQHGLERRAQALQQRLDSLTAARPR